MGLSRRVSQLPLTAISFGLEAWERSRGLREFALRRGNEALQIAAHTPLGRLLPQQVHDDGADEEAAVIAAAAREDTPAPPRPVTPPAPTAATPKPTAKAAPKAEPKPAAKPAEPPRVAKEMGAPGAVTREVEQISEQLHIETPASRDELAIPDFDNISIGSLRARLRSLSVEQLVALREWEQEHANRLPVITMLDNRIAKLSVSSTVSGSTSGGIAYPQEAVRAEHAAEGEGGTLRV